jgi:hypothetical protein
VSSHWHDTHSLLNCFLSNTIIDKRRHIHVSGIASQDTPGNTIKYTYTYTYLYPSLLVKLLLVIESTVFSNYLHDKLVADRPPA